MRMNPIQLVSTRHAALPYIAEALSMRLATGAEWLSTYAAFILRRLIGTMAPCSRRDLRRQAKLALAGITEEALDDLINGALEDLIVGGDVLELPVLAEGHGAGTTLQILGARPSFVIQDPRIRILGIAPDDARFLPEDVQARVQARGGDRFIEAEDTTEVCALLMDLGLQQIEVARWLGADTDEPADTFLRRMADYLQRMGRNESLVEMQWLWPSDGQPASYRDRWHADHPLDAGMCIARAPQRYGNPRWYLVATGGAYDQRILELPLDGEAAVRACDLAWRIQLALDYTRGHPMRYHVTRIDADWAQIRIEFPLSLHDRRRMLHLGGRRISEDHGFRFTVPLADLPSAEAILTSAWMVPAKTRESP
jgi:hypothetical protein